MKRAAALSVVLLASTATAAFVEACDGSTDIAPSAADAATDRGRDRQTPTAQEEEDAEPECVRGDAAAVSPPPPFRDRKNPLPATAGVVSEGRTLFANRCALCHGDEGEGDGREGPFDPPPANFTVRSRSDAYLFWRISEGGAASPFCSAMPAFEGLYSETQRWELVTFIQATFAPKLDAGSDGADAD